MNMYFLPAIRLLIITFVPATSLLISPAESSVGLYLTSYPMIIPFLSFSSGGSQDRVAEVLVLITFKFSGGPLGALEKERIVYKRSSFRKHFNHYLYRGGIRKKVNKILIYNSLAKLYGTFMPQLLLMCTI